MTNQKGSTLPTSFSDQNIKNGFKDVFGTTRTNFYDHPQMSSMSEKKLKVGNKKSDKFLGEDLSEHLSDEPFNEQDLDTVKSETDKKLSFFLMNMLEDMRDRVEEDRYEGKEPIEEPKFVARKRITKHICDDDEFHIHEKSTIAPPKPDRDFSKINAEIQSETPNETPRIEIVDSNVTEKCDDRFDNYKKSRKFSNIVDEMMTKAYGIGNFNPEDCSHHTHDELVTPTSKLSVRKISTGRKISTDSFPSLYNESNSESSQKTVQKAHNSETDEVENAFMKLHNDANDAGQASVNDIVEEIYSGNSKIMNEFQNFLEQTIRKDQIKDVEGEKIYVDHEAAIDDKDDEVENELRRYSDSFESTDEEQHDISKRSSIKDCEKWFSQHVEREETESDVCNNVRDLERPLGYDHKKIFPFGIAGPRRDSLSDEFFSDVSPIMKIVRDIPTVRGAEKSTEFEDELTEKNDQKKLQESPDHSVLYKYINKSSDEA